ncbi:MAG TPA: hypothetical protein VKP88_00695, partial [Candidatus Paceibacterota bacterium]|nr:hypothetical protein [Candidatus Paceibacterota bacterium]
LVDAYRQFQETGEWPELTPELTEALAEGGLILGSNVNRVATVDSGRNPNPTITTEFTRGNGSQYSAFRSSINTIEEYERNPEALEAIAAAYYDGTLAAVYGLDTVNRSPMVDHYRFPEESSPQSDVWAASMEIVEEYSSGHVAYDDPDQYNPADPNLGQNETLLDRVAAFPSRVYSTIADAVLPPVAEGPRFASVDEAISVPTTQPIARPEGAASLNAPPPLDEIRAYGIDPIPEPSFSDNVRRAPTVPAALALVGEVTVNEDGQFETVLDFNVCDDASCPGGRERVSVPVRDGNVFEVGGNRYRADIEHDPVTGENTVTLERQPNNIIDRGVMAVQSLTGNSNVAEFTEWDTGYRDPITGE